MKRCAKCIMPEVDGHISINDNGICNICQTHEKVEKIINYNKKYNKNVLLKKIEKYKNNNIDHNCIVAVSGGKDSILTLKIAKQELGLKPLAIFIDNGFSTNELVKNASHAANKLNIDLIIYKTNIFKNIFKKLLVNDIPVYYCRICHAIIDKIIRDIAKKFNLNLLLGGYTKGQDYIKQKELFWIFKETDENFKNFFSQTNEFIHIVEMFPNLAAYFSKYYNTIETLSPFWYIDWDEKKIIDMLKKEMNFQIPKISWPDQSSNCLFNFISQSMAIKKFGYAQHESELSTLIRRKELSRERALEIIETPITKENIQLALDRMNLKYTEIFN